MKKWLLALGIAAGLPAWAMDAEAHQPGFVSVGINLGGPYHPRPWCGPCYHPYYRPYPVYVAPAPVYVAPAPIYVSPPPVAYQPVPVVRPAIAPAPSSVEPNPFTTASVQSDANRYLQLLFDQEERVRGDAALELGRLRADRAVEPLCTLLNSDRSPLVRDAAARALGLIGATRALGALQNAAQTDSDRDVRRSAQFSAEVIRATSR